jgi:hypothetical protein
MASYLGSAAVITFGGTAINTYYRKAKSDESIWRRCGKPHSAWIS